MNIKDGLEFNRMFFESPIDVLMRWMLGQILASISPQPHRISFLRLKEGKAVYVMGEGRRVPIAGRTIELPTELAQIKSGQVEKRPTPKLGWDLFLGISTAQMTEEGEKFQEAGLIVVDDIGVARRFSDAEITLLSDGARWFADLLSRKRESISFKRLAETDGLTDLLNHRAILGRLQKEAEEALCNSQELTIALIDLDHFKTVNDTYGHPFGDEILRGVANLFKDLEGVLAGRYGGEEFLLLLEMELGEALRVLNRAREQWAAREWKIPGFSSTFSAGLCEVSANRMLEMIEWAQANQADVDLMLMSELSRNFRDDSHDDWQREMAGQASSLGVQVADGRLYIAKGRGRNCCVAENSV